MKILFLCGCLFLSLCLCPIQALESWEAIIESWEEQIYTVNSQESTKVSQQISKAYEQITQDWMDAKAQWESFQNMHNEYQIQKEILNAQLLDCKAKVSFFLLKEQKAYPYLANPWMFYIRSAKYYQEWRCLYSLQNRWNQQEHDLLYKMHESAEKRDKYQAYRHRLESCQKLLFERFQEHNAVRPKHGEYPKDRKIQGVDQLPVYGTIYAKEREHQDTCLSFGQYSIDSYSASWNPVIKHGTISAGTWSYPQGGLHLGMDVASDLYTSVLAPANGLILYADAPVGSNDGYLGNWCGWPAGGGNTICMLAAVQDRIYAVTLAHLSDQIYVYPGQQVLQGDVLALSGNSGNSSGPHTHIEVFLLRCSLQEAVLYFMENADFSFGNGFDQANTCSKIACRIQPESIF